MQTTLAILALAAASAVNAQGVAAGTLLPSTSTPAGCSQNYNGKFEITVVTPASSKRDLEKRQSSCTETGVAILSLSNGILTDSEGRIGGIVANRQFQFDGPPSQTGTIYNGGWSVCNNGSIAIGGQALFYQCLTSNFYNLYDQNIGAQCEPVLIDIIPCSGAPAASAPASSAPAVSASTGASSARTTAPAATGTSSAKASAVTQYTDGQLQAQSARPISQYSDGQLQGTARPMTVTAVPVSQFSDGQIQATKKATTTAVPVSQFTDGQIQATPRASTSARATTTARPVSQISDGQIQAASTTLTRASSTAVYTGAAAAATPIAGLAAVAAIAALL